MNKCEKIVKSSKYLEAQGLTQEQLSSLHHFELEDKNRVTFKFINDYFSTNKNIKELNTSFSERISYVAEKHQEGNENFPQLIRQALEKRPLSNGNAFEEPLKDERTTFIQKPNLFNFATSELSQDAFICWLLSWGKPECKTIDKNLHDCSIKLIKALFKKHKGIIIPATIEKVEVIKQIKNIDILCIINDNYPILIEDKTNTKDHSDQLIRYLREVRDMAFDEKNIIPIYFKTQDQDSYSDIEEQGYKCFLRDDFLNILNTYKGSDQILLDYRTYLQSISDSVNSYKDIPPSEWKWDQWVGFYCELGKNIDNSGWHYVPNQNGGFLGFHCFWSEALLDNRCEVFIHLEQDKLCFKIWVANKEERQYLRNEWSNIFCSKEREIKLIKPSRFGSGEYMTVCVLADGDYRIVDEFGKIDMEKTTHKIQQVAKALELTYADAIHL